MPTALTGERKNSVSLYVHIPFCRKKCDYCDFFSIGTQSRTDTDQLRNEYVAALSQELAFYAWHYAVLSWKSIYIGGGTPSQLTPSQLAALMRGIFAAAPAAPAAEVTLEVNPDDVTEELLAVCARAGINRISMGVQAFDQKALDAVRRGASAASALRALELLQTHWRGRLSCDLIAGLPLHTYASFADGIRTLTAFSRVEHVSLYTLTVEAGTPLAAHIARGSVPWSADKADRMWVRGRNLLERAGFLQYEVSNFARAGCESRHNLTYWQLQDYIGCGAGASGTVYGMPSGACACTADASAVSPRCAEGTRWTNTTDLAAYLRFWLQGAAPVPSALSDPSFLARIPRETETLDAATQEAEFLMMGFRLLRGVSRETYRARFGSDLAARIGSEAGVFADWKKRALARQYAVRAEPCQSATHADTRYALTRRGILLLNRFLEAVW